MTDLLIEGNPQMPRRLENQELGERDMGEGFTLGFSNLSGRIVFDEKPKFSVEPEKVFEPETPVSPVLAGRELFDESKESKLEAGEESKEPAEPGEGVGEQKKPDDVLEAVLGSRPEGKTAADWRKVYDFLGTTIGPSTVFSEMNVRILSDVKKLLFAKKDLEKNEVVLAKNQLLSFVNVSLADVLEKQARLANQRAELFKMQVVLLAFCSRILEQMGKPDFIREKSESLLRVGPGVDRNADVPLLLEAVFKELYPEGRPAFAGRADGAD